jgi:uncharacterized protein with ParB-like and HNH nuclease domain
MGQQNTNYLISNFNFGIDWQLFSKFYIFGIQNEIAMLSILLSFQRGNLHVCKISSFLEQDFL